MKTSFRFAALLVCIALMIGTLASCSEAGGLATKETETVTKQEETKTPATEPVEEFTGHASVSDFIDLERLESRLKLWGRGTFDEKGLHVDFPLAGFEMRVQADGGDFKLGYRFSTAAMVTVLVDGEEAERKNLSGTGNVTLTKLSAGEHSIAVLRDVEARGGAEAVFTRVAFSGEVLDRPEDKEFYIEFIGDSIVSGNGTLTEGQAKWTSTENSTTHAFGYLTARELGADVSVVGRGSIGLVKTVEDAKGTPIAMPLLYRLATGLSHDPRITFDFKNARVPDLIVLEVSTNDRSTISDDQFRTAAEKFLPQIREYWGKDIPIVWVYNLMIEDHHEAVLLETVEKLGGEANGYYTLKLVAGQNGGKGTDTGTCHPSYGDHQVNTTMLANFLREKGLAK